MRKNFVRVIAVLSVVVVICCLPVVFACEHENKNISLTSEPTCTVEGIETITCADCGETLGTRNVDVLGHAFGDYVVIYKPSANKHGKEFCSCSTCGLKEYRDVVCPHTETVSERLLEPTCGEFGVEQFMCTTCETVWEEPIEKLSHENTVIFNLKEPSCLQEGLERIICNDCGQIAEERSIAKIECNYGEWNFIKYATPFESGERYRICNVCGNKDVDYYSVTMNNNSIYIPTADIFCNFAVAQFTQEAVDSNDVIYTNCAYSTYDKSNPFVLGHWYGTLGNMHKTKVGSYVYICVNGNIDTYEVINSEYAILRWNEIDMVGKLTGVNVWDTYGSRLNSQYYRTDMPHKGVDRWNDVNDGKTLHMYTCHYGKDKEFWEPKDGHNGRWIILANLVDSCPVSN